jgi:sugar lactone lactonase YvrE
MKLPDFTPPVIPKQKNFHHWQTLKKSAGLLLFASAIAGAMAQSTVPAPAYAWSTLAGRASRGREDGAAADARFSNPGGLARDNAGTTYVADTGNHTIRAINAAGIVSTLAGSPGQPGTADGAGAAARFNQPRGIAVDSAGNLYVTDSGNYTIRKITPTGVVTTLAGKAGSKGTTDGAATATLFDSLDQISVDGMGNVYVADHGIREIAGGSVTTIYTGGTVTAADGTVLTVTAGNSVAADASGNIYFTGTAAPWTIGPGRCVLKRDAGGTVTFVGEPKDFGSYQTTAYASDFGPMTLDQAGGVHVSVQWQYYYGPEEQLWRPADAGYGIFFKASSGWPDKPRGLVVDTSGTVLFTRSTDHAIMTTGTSPRVFAGTPASNRILDGTGAAARLPNVQGLTTDAAGNIWIADQESVRFYDNRGGEGASLRKVRPSGEVSTLYYRAPTFSPSTNALGAAMAGDSSLYFGSRDYFFRLTQVAADGSATPLANDGLPNDSIYFISQIATNPSGLLVAAEFSKRLHQRNSSGAWTLLAGGNTATGNKDGSGAGARFDSIRGLTAGRSGDFYVLDSAQTSDGLGNCYIRKITTNGEVTTVSENLVIPTGLPAPNASLTPLGLGIDSHGTFFVTYGDGTVRQVAPAGEPIVIGGEPFRPGSLDGTGRQALFDYPTAIAVDTQDVIYVTDADGTTIRKGQYLGTGPTITAQPQSQSITAGGSVQFLVSASATPAPTYQWQFNGAAISGATMANHRIAAVKASDAGSYTVVVSNAYGSTTSSVATLTVGTGANSGGSGGDGAGAGGGGSGGGAQSFCFVVLLTGLAVARVVQTRLKAPTTF